jgi:hypothetical protein
MRGTTSGIQVIDIGGKAIRAGTSRVRTILSPAADHTRVEVSVREIDADQTQKIEPSDRTQVAYVVEVPTW